MRRILFFALIVTIAPQSLGAGAYPVKSVRVVAPFAPSGSVDTTARLISPQLAEQLGKPFIVDNRTGASGTIGNAIVAKSAADGYTLMLADTSTVIAGSLYKTLPFDVARDFSPITQIMRAPQVLVVNAALNAGTLKEFVALAQANPGKFNYGSAGSGGQLHLVAELFNMAARKTLQNTYGTSFGVRPK